MLVMAGPAAADVAAPTTVIIMMMMVMMVVVLVTGRGQTVLLHLSEGDGCSS